MQIRVDRHQFLAELTLMQGIVERKSTIPVLSHILLTAEGDRLRIAATDLDVSLTSFCAAKVERAGAIAVQARKLQEIIRSLRGDEVDLAEEKEQTLTIEGGNSRFRIHGLPAEDFPNLPQLPEDDGLALPQAKLRKLIGKILFAVSAEESRFQLNGALLKLKDDGLEIVATDSHRLALVEAKIPGVTAAEGVLVPRKALHELQRFEGEEDIRFTCGEHHLVFRSGRRELISRILEGTFPDYERVVEKRNEFHASFDKKELAEAVQRVALLTGDRARAVRLDFTEGQVEISAANPDLGEAREELPCQYEGEALRLGLNPDYLGQFLSAVEAERVRFEMQNEDTQCVGFPEGEEDRYLCVIMPMRV
jgi:DNA polymerase-3 subunit beta